LEPFSDDFEGIDSVLDIPLGNTEGDSEVSIAFQSLIEKNSSEMLSAEYMFELKRMVCDEFKDV
jgi:hypothetical protein